MGKLFVGLDVHKETIQMSVMDGDGNEMLNEGIQNSPESIFESFKDFPKGTSMVIESSSVWKAPFFQLRDAMGFDVTLSNAYATRLIAKSKKKTDRIDAMILADLLRGNYIVECHVPSRQAMENRDLTRHRDTYIRTRTKLKNGIHGILLQKGIHPSGTSFSEEWIRQVRAIGDYRIDSYLGTIDYISGQILKADLRIRDAANADEDAKLLRTCPGVGDLIALIISCEIDGIDRFADSSSLCAFAGIIPSVRASAGKAAYGHITHHGSSMMRWALVHAARMHIRYNPNSDLAAFHSRLAKKRTKSVAMVAAAAKLLRMLYRVLEERRPFVTNYGQGVSCEDWCGGKPRLISCRHP